MDSAGADAGNQDIHAPIGIVPNLRSSGFQVDLGIGRVVELLRHETVWGFGENLQSFSDCALHPVRTRCEDNFRAEGEQKYAPFQAHGIRHRQNQLVPAYARHKCPAEAGRPTGGLDQHRFARLNFFPARSASVAYNRDPLRWRKDSSFPVSPPPRLAAQPFTNTLLSRTSGVEHDKLQ